MRTTGTPRRRRAAPVAAAAWVTLAGLALVGCSSGPTAEEARARTEEVLRDVGIAALPDGVGTTPRDAADVVGCTTERVHRIRLDLEVPEDVDLLGAVRAAWQERGQVVAEPESVSLTTDDGWLLVASTSRGATDQAGLRAQSPCFEAATP